MIRADSLQEMDTDVSGTIQTDRYLEGLERHRDVIKKFAAGMTFVLLGVEAQQHIHYAMPLRNMLYDGMGYLKEYRSFPGRTGKFSTSDEFLSKMKKDDKLHPIITLTIYYGETPWDGPLTLRDMMAEIPKEMESAFCDYSMNLLEIRKSGAYIFYNKDVAMAFDFTRAVFENHVDEALEKYKNAEVNEEVWNFIDTMIDAKNMIAQKYIRSEPMCEALRLWAQEKADQGLSQGRQEGELVGEIAGQKMIINHMLENNMPLDKISQLIGFPVEKIKEILSTERVYN